MSNESKKKVDPFTLLSEEEKKNFIENEIKQADLENRRVGFSGPALDYYIENDLKAELVTGKTDSYVPPLKPGISEQQQGKNSENKKTMEGLESLKGIKISNERNPGIEPIINKKNKAVKIIDKVQENKDKIIVPIQNLDGDSQDSEFIAINTNIDNLTTTVETGAQKDIDDIVAEDETVTPEEKEAILIKKINEAKQNLDTVIVNEIEKNKNEITKLENENGTDVKQAERLKAQIKKQFTHHKTKTHKKTTTKKTHLGTPIAVLKPENKQTDLANTTKDSLNEEDKIKQEKLAKTIKEAQDKIKDHIDKRVEEENQKLDIKIEARELDFLANQEIDIKAKYFNTKEKIQELQNKNGSQEEIDLLNKELEIYTTQREEISKKLGEQTDKLNNLSGIKQEASKEETSPELLKKQKRDRLSNLFDEEHQIKQSYFDLQNKVENNTASEEERELYEQQKNRRSEIEQEKDELNKFFLGEEYFATQDNGNTENIQETNPEIRNFLQKLSLEGKDLVEFRNLNEAQKLKVVEDLKQRIIDLTKADANTQYAESISSGVKQSTGGFFNKIKVGFVNLKNKIGSSLTKETTIKDIEAESFKKLTETEEGKSLITKEIKNLVKINKDRDIYLNENNKPQINFINKEEIENLTTEEEQHIENFNQIANNFRKMPYEWGQEGNKNKKSYEKVQKEYELAREKILKIKSLREGGQAIINTLQSDNALRLDQLLNTHPEFEKEFNNLGEQKGVKEMAKNVGNFLETVTGGKNMVNKLLVGMGYGLRMGAKGAAVATSMTGITLVAAPIIGGTIGALRGKVRAEDTLKERQIQARRGIKDGSNEATNTNDAENLSKRIELLIASYNNAKTDIEKNEKLDQLKRRIEFTQDKIEQGLVNFGDAKNSLNNQFNLINALNNATVLSASREEHTNKAIDDRLEEFLAYKKNTITQKQKEYIKVQMKRGAMLGAGFATAGYLARWVGEQYGLFGNIQEVQSKNINLAPGDNSELKVEDNTFPQDNTRVVKNLDIKKPDFSQAINTEEVKEVIDNNQSQNEIIIEDNTVPQDNTRVAQYLEKPKDFTSTTPDSENTTIIEKNNEIKIEDNTVPQESTRVENHVEKPNELIKPKTPETTPNITNNEINNLLKFDEGAIVRKGEGVTHVFVRQMENNHKLATALGFQGDFENSKDLINFSKELAIKTGYIDQEGHEIRVSVADKVAYVLSVDSQGNIEVNEIDVETGKPIDTPHHEGDTLEKDIEKYEYLENKKIDNTTEINQTTEGDPVIFTDSAPTPDADPVEDNTGSLTKEEIISPVKSNKIEESLLWKSNFKNENFLKYMDKNTLVSPDESKIIDYLKVEYAEAQLKDPNLKNFLTENKSNLEEARELFNKINHKGYKTGAGSSNLLDNKENILIPENFKDNPEFKALSIIAEKNKYNLTEDMFKNIEKTKTESLKAIFGKDIAEFEKDKNLSVVNYRERWDDDLVKYLKLLEEKTGLTPEFHVVKDRGESVLNFMNRALLHAANTGKSDQVMFIKEKILDAEYDDKYFNYQKNK